MLSLVGLTGLLSVSLGSFLQATRFMSKSKHKKAEKNFFITHTLLYISSDRYLPHGKVIVSPFELVVIAENPSGTT